MSRIFVDGREIDVPRDARGQINVGQLRDTLGLRRGRDLILQRHSGENIVLPKRGWFEVDPYAHFAETGAAKRGQR